MSGKEERTGGDSLQSTGDLAGGPDNQEREGIYGSPNFAVAWSLDVQLGCGHFLSKDRSQGVKTGALLLAFGVGK